MLSLGFSVLQSLEIRDVARPYLEKLARECDKTVNLAMIDKLEMVFIERIKVYDFREFSINIGDRVPVYNTAVGKAVLAHLRQDKVSEILEEIRKDSVAVRNLGKNLSNFIKGLDEVRKSGFAVNNQELRRGLRAIAVPIFTSQGVYCAVNVVVASELISMDEVIKKYVPKLIKIGKEISEAMGYQGQR